MLLKAYSRKRPQRRKLPFNVELLAWVDQNVHRETDPEPGAEIRAALILSFSLACAQAQFGTYGGAI